MQATCMRIASPPTAPIAPARVVPECGVRFHPGAKRQAMPGAIHLDHAIRGEIAKDLHRACEKDRPAGFIAARLQAAHVR